MKTFLCALVVSSVLALGAGREIYGFFSKLTSPASAMAAQESGDVQSITGSTRAYAHYLDTQTGRTADEYKYQCQKCKTGFDVPALGRKCPNCKSKKITKNEQADSALKQYKRQISEFE